MKFIDSLFAKKRLKEDYQTVFGSEPGRRVMADILKRAGVTLPIFDSNPEKARLLEGHRHLAFSIYRMVHSSDEQLLKLIAEETRRSSEQATQTEQ